MTRKNRYTKLLKPDHSKGSITAKRTLPHNTPFVPDEIELKRMELKLDRARQIQIDNYLDLEEERIAPIRITISKATREQVIDALHKIKT